MTEREEQPAIQEGEELQQAIDAAAAEAAYRRADAWARSAPGTPYGALSNSTEEAKEK